MFEVELREEVIGSWRRRIPAGDHTRLAELLRNELSYFGYED